MKHLVVLGAGTAGTMVVNRLSRDLDRAEWRMTIVDQQATHYYQPGFLFLPFGIYGPNDVIKPTRAFIPRDVELVMAEIERIDPVAKRVHLIGAPALAYDVLVIATGTAPQPEETPGLVGAAWGQTLHEFYTYPGAMALTRALRTWPGGRLVVNVMETPIKCPVAPLEFIFLADAWFRQRGLRPKVELTYATPLSGAFTKPRAAGILGGMLAEKGINLVADFYPESVDAEAGLLRSYDEQELGYDLLVTVPVNKGAAYIARSELGDELNHVPVDAHNFLARGHDDIFALGDAAALPTSKAGSVAHFAVDVFCQNFGQYAAGRPMSHAFDGHANCFIESGHGRGILIDFNYDVEPLPGKYPLPGVGPFALLHETQANHWGKMAFRWIYWNVLLKGRDMPVSTEMSMAGKEQ